MTQEQLKNQGRFRPPDGNLVLYADLHIHSYLSRATSAHMNLQELSKNALRKGLTLLGTGDFTHPIWIKEIKGLLSPFGESGLYSFGGVLWMLQTEVSTVYKDAGKTRKVHHIIYAPDFETVDQINDVLSEYGKLDVDGRPIFNNITSPRLVEMLKAISPDIHIIPAHAWTSWWSIFGAFSGFDSVKECYQDQVGHIFALETGLSSDPPMNWRLSELDDYALVSNSDAHSPWIWRLGREFNAFKLDTPSYREIFDAIRESDGSRFLFTGEVSPEYGKYHLTGHRKCGIRLSPSEASRRQNVCPRCGRKLTVGVLQRVEELADRPEGYSPQGAIPYRTILPLYEIISHMLGVKALYSKRVLEILDGLISRFGTELRALL
ncbi:MAG: endonuclease Q family protein, partial [Candidatus Geothermarchaeales archaeon]